MMRDAATQRQVDAADPANSTWLLANAGSGKTRVLTDRVARLLLADVDPQNILCLTYTKAAAAEMQNRLFKRLGAWAMMEDAALRDDLLALGVDHAIDAARLRAARTLFARAIETPGGLKIQTIHSFCAGVLRRFPLEAEVSPQFREMEDRDAALLRQEVMDALVSGADAQVVEAMLARLTAVDFSQFTAEVARNRDHFARDVSRADLAAVLDLPADARREDALAMAFFDGTADIAKALGEVFAGSTKTYQAFASDLLALDYDSPGWDGLEVLFKKFLDSKGRSKSGNYPQSNHTKAIEAMAPIADEVFAWMDRVAEARDYLWAMDALERTEALYAFGRAFVPAYEARKLAMGALDFDDLIRKAKALLTDPNVAQWVLFRLDGGIDHVLVDEAQDTSPPQWAVIQQLTQEFAAGIGARPDRARTVFVVGDKKQSIYSFQGADPDAFDAMKAHFSAAQAATPHPLVATSLDHSFRSSQAILSVVDASFTGPHGAGMTDGVSHIAFKDMMPGRVDLWPVIAPPEQHKPENWYDPVDKPSKADHQVVMAERVADQIKRMIAEETLPEEIGNSGTYRRRRISAGDFLILVQRRSDLFAEIIRACKAAGLNMAGADRLRVGAELAVKDLAALLRFLALPEDDLSLAACLRSPLFGWSEQDLFTLAHHRPENGYLWAALRDGDYPQTRNILDDLRKQSDFLRPYDLIARILTRHDGRRKLLARLGAEAEDGIDALLSQALAYEGTGVPSLTGFLTWMETDDLEVKRQMDAQGDRIRVMTVHGAKGLEAPIVILPETGSRELKFKNELLPAGDHLIWKTTLDVSPSSVLGQIDLAKAKEMRERLRLLYVAMTRAEKWLIVGAAGKVADDDGSWYNIVKDGMAARGAVTAKAGDLDITRVAHLDWTAGDLRADAAPEPAPVEKPVFGTLPVITRDVTRAPSDLGGAKALAGEHQDTDEDALERGTLIHRLLEHLPLIPAAQRLELGLRLIGRDDPGMVRDVIALLENPALAELWQPDALTEVDVTADIDGLGRIHGTIDRLLVTQGHVLAVDYKSNAIVPATAAQVPEGLLRQMAVYHNALRQIYPDHAVSVAILWTQTAGLMPLPPDLLQGAMARAL